MARAKSAVAQRRPRSARSLVGASTALASARRRRALIVVDVDHGSEDNYLFSYLADEQSMGIFVRTLAPHPTGTHLTLRFVVGPADSEAAPRAAATDRIPRLAVLDDDLEAELDAELEAELDAELGETPDDELAPDLADLADLADLRELKIEGEVIWVNSYRPSVKDNLHPGMGVRIISLDTPTRARLLALVGRFAYLT